MHINRRRRRTSVQGCALGVALVGSLIIVPPPASSQVTASQSPAARQAPAAARALAVPSLVDNGAFHYGLRGWRAGGRGVGKLVLGKGGRAGTRAATVTARRSGVAAIWNSHANSAIELVRGDRVTVSAWVRSNQAGRKLILTTKGRAGTRRAFSKTYSSSLGNTKWHQVSRSFTVTRGATNLVTQLKVPSLAAGHSLVVDNVAVRVAAVHRRISAGFDGLRLGSVRPADFLRTVGGTNKSKNAYEDTFIVRDTRRAGRVLRTRLDANAIHSKPSGNHGIVAFIPLGARLQHACISYQIRFDSKFAWSMGGKLPGLEGVAPGVSPSLPSGGQRPGSKGWSGRMMWISRNADGRARGANTPISYMYGPKQWSQYGDNLLWPRHFRAGRWHSVMQCYTMNTPGRTNGVLRGWFDGSLVLNRRFLYRTRSDVGINYVAWSIFRGGNTLSWASSRTGYVDIDNLLITGR
jgi:hypothetical protein